MIEIMKITICNEKLNPCFNFLEFVGLPIKVTDSAYGM